VSRFRRIPEPIRSRQTAGVSAKALRLMSSVGCRPGPHHSRWRAMVPDELAKAAEIVALRALGLSLAQVAQVLGATRNAWSRPRRHTILARGRIRQLAITVEKGSRAFRARPRRSQAPAAGELARLLEPVARTERSALSSPGLGAANGSELPNVRPLNYLTGPARAGKARPGALRLRKRCQGRPSWALTAPWKAPPAGSDATNGDAAPQVERG